jgi:hypothetical protein
VSVPARRRQVAYGREHGLSARRACTLFEVARSALSYARRMPAKDGPVIERMQALSAQYPRYGYRRIRIFLGRDGHRMSIGRAYRLWQAAGLQVPRKRPRKRVAAARPRPQGQDPHRTIMDLCARRPAVRRRRSAGGGLLLLARPRRRAPRGAAIHTLIETAKLNDVDPQAWLADVLARLQDHPARRIAELLPWNCKRQPPQRAAA